MFVLIGPIAVSVGFVAFASRVVHRPDPWYGVIGWWVGLTLTSTLVLTATERLMRKIMPLVALFNLSLVFPDHAPSRFKVAMRTNTVRQLQRSLEAGPLEQVDFQEAAERLVALAGALNAHDRMTRGHTERVRAYTLMIGEELHLPKADLDRLHWAGLVHDVGKLEVPTSILNKSGRPDDDEWEILKQHPAAAVRLLEPLRPWLGEWADAASQHHERWDGNGYPFGLAGEEISLSGRVVAVADAYDVMTSVRSYKKAMTPQAARAELLRCAGTQFDPDVVRAFLNISVGKLRLVMGPLSWLAQAPVLGNVPLGTVAVTAASSLVSVAIAVAAGLTGSTDPAPMPAPAVAFAGSPVVARTMTIRGREDEPLTLHMPTAWAQEPTSMKVISVPDHLHLDPASTTVLTPDANWFGHSTGQYEACWNDTCSTSVLNIDVQSVNDLPIAWPDGATTVEETAVAIDVLANDTDVEDDAPLLTDVRIDFPMAAGTTTLTADNKVLFRPATGFVGTVLLEYAIRDSDGGVATGTITVGVTAVDDPPRAVDDNATIVSPEPPPSPPPSPLSRPPNPAPTAGSDQATMTEDSPPINVDILANDISADGNLTDDTITIIGAPGVGTASIVGQQLRYQPNPDANGTDTIKYQLCEATRACAAATVTVTITPRNDRPVFIDAGSVDVNEDSGPTTINGWASSIAAGPPNESAQNVGFTVTVDQPTLFTTLPAVDATGALNFTPSSDSNGTATITVTAVDDGGTSNGGQDGSIAHTATITITPVNDAPTFTDGGNLSVTEDSGSTTITGWATAIRTGPANEADQHLTFSVHVDQPDLFQIAPGIDPSGTLRFTPAPNANGVLTMSVTATDDGGVSAGGHDTTTTHAATIAIRPVNDAPQFIDLGNITATEDVASSTTAGWAHSIVPGPLDEAAQVVSFSAVADQPALFSAQPTIDPAGTLTFAPAPNAHGTATITVTATDDGGTSDGGNDTSAVHTATITITSINDPVIAADDTATVNEDDTAGITTNVLSNDTDADNDPLTVTSIDITTLAGGTVTDLGNGLINYTPDPNFNGTDTFSYTVSDGNGSTDTSIVTITVNPVPDAPVATADAFTTTEDTAVVVAAPGLIGNDYDEDGDPLTISSTPIAGPSDGTLTLGTDGAFTYIPNTGFIGTDTFTYRLNDSTGLTATTTVTITVDSGLSAGGLYLGNTQSLGTWNMTVSPPPNANPEPDYDLDGNPGITVAKDGALATKTWIRNISGNPLALNGPATLELWSTIAGFLPNKDGHPDITLYDCNALGLSCVTVGHTSVHMNKYNGTVADWVRVDISLGNITYTFPVGRQLRLQVRQGHNDLWIAASATRPSRLTYTLANIAPVAADDTPPALLEDAGPTGINVLANDIDNNLDPTTVTITTPPAKGTATPNPDGTITYLPTADANGADSFDYRVCDTGGLCATATVNITITPVNDRPTFVAGPDITINATDPPYSQVGWATGITTGPTNESAQTPTFTITAADRSLFSVQPTLSATGTLTFSPNGTPGSTTITIQLTDNGGTANGGINTAVPGTATISID